MSFSIPGAAAEDAGAVEEATRFMNQMQRDWKKEIWLLTMFRFIQFILRCLQLLVTARLLAGMVLEKDQHAAGVYFLILAVSAVLMLVFSYLHQRVAANFSSKVSTRVRLDILYQMEQGLSRGQFQKRVGEAILLLEKQSDAIAPYFQRYLPQKYISMVTPLMIAAVVGYISWICGLIMLLILPMIPLYMMMIGKGTVSASQSEWQVLADMGGYFYNRLKGLTTLSIFSTAQRETVKILDKSQRYHHSALKVLRMAFLSSAAIDFFTTIIIASMAIIVGLGMIGYVGFFSVVSLSDGLVLLILVPEFFTGLKKLGLYYHDRAQALGAMMDFQREGFFSENTASVVKPSPQAVLNQLEPVTLSACAVSIENLCFGYHHDEKLFDNFSLSLNWSQRILLEGLNGAGKSTLLDLLHGFRLPQSGKVRLAGIDVSLLGMEDISSLLGWAGQQSRILQGSLRYNLCMGQNLDDTAIFNALKPYFDLETFLSPYENGLDTLIREDGKTISGGERHKISLARVILKNAPILLLDEPFTYLDSLSTTKFIAGLSNNALQKTIILISHHQQNLQLVNFKKIQLHDQA